MAEPRPGRDRSRLALTAALVVVTALSGCAEPGVDQMSHVPEPPERVLPWEWWRDLAVLARVPVGDRVVMRSSHCPTGCEFDRHSEADPRFLRINEAGEGVIFSAEGAGAVTRIWMVMGDGVSEDLDPSIRLRVRIDGRRKPVIDLPLPEVFDGWTAPFVAPLVAAAGVSGGGNVSYVPIPFREGCEVSLVGAERARIWFQVSARLVADPRGVRSFTGKEPLDGMQAMLIRVGDDPWQRAASPTASGVVVLAPGGGEVIAELEGPDMVTGILLRAPRKHWHRLGLRLGFDDREPQLIPILDLFGVLSADAGLTRSLMVGGDGDSDLYCYFPMPYFERATIELLRRPVEGPASVRVEYAIRRAGEAPPDDAGYFGVQVRREPASTPGGDLPLLELDGAGSWVGLVADLAPARRATGWSFLEGDERVSFDGEATPSWNGTGVEDLFNGGFYFRGVDGWPVPFATALAGAPVLRRGNPRAVMYRLFLGDAAVFQGGIRAGLEGGPTGRMSLRARSVAYVYARDRGADDHS